MESKERTPEQMEMIEKHFPMVSRLVRAFVSGRNDLKHVSVSDLFQEGCLTLFRVADKFDPTRGVKFGTYAYHRVYGSFRDYLIREGYSVPIKTTYLQAPESDNPDFRVELNFLREKLNHAVNLLPARKRDILELYYGQGLPMIEIGPLVEVHPSRVSQLHAEAIEFLRQRLGIKVKKQPTSRKKRYSTRTRKLRLVVSNDHLRKTA